MKLLPFQRLFDLAVSGIALAVLAPVMLLVAVIIVLDSGWPIFFSQTRVGQHGRHFRMHKFRKFHKRAPDCGGALTLENDVRLSRVGRILAWTKVDELPQLWNVLAGEMSVLGPRPESLDFEDCFDECHRDLLKHRPGIFGPSQLVFRNEAALYRGRPSPEKFYREVLFPLKAQIDSEYFAHRTLYCDIACLMSCALAVAGLSATDRNAAALVTAATRGARRNSFRDHDLSVRVLEAHTRYPMRSRQLESRRVGTAGR